MTSRVFGGFGSGIIFIIAPTYMKELLNLENANNVIVDILITQFGMGICAQYFMGECEKVENFFGAHKKYIKLIFCYNPLKISRATSLKCNSENSCTIQT